MAANPSTVDTIKSWYESNLGRAADQGGLDYWTSRANSGGDLNSLKNDFLWAAQNNGAKVNQPSQPTSSGLIGSVTNSPSPAPKAQSTPNQPAVNVSNWYRSSLGRDPDQAGISYWENELKTRDANSVYDSFLHAARANNARVNENASFANANTYSGPRSSDSMTVIDDWGRNVLGRELTPAEVAKYAPAFESAKTADAARKVYEQFIADNAGQVKAPMDLAAASQISALAPAPTLLDINSLDRRVIDAGTETVRGQLGSLLDENSPYLQRARALGQRQMAERGLINSSMAGTAGEAAAIDAALQIATPDAATYGRAGDYNTALTNQAHMYNADALNAASTQARNLSQQMTIAQMQDATSRYQIEKQDATSRYNTDAQYRRQADANADTLINNILMTPDLSPDRKAALLESLGKGTSARRDANGNIIAGTGLAGAVYVIDDVGKEWIEAARRAGVVGGYGGSEGGDSGNNGDGDGDSMGGVNGSAGTGDGDAMG